MIASCSHGAAAGTRFGYGIRSAVSHERRSPAPAGRGTIEIGECAAVTLDESVVVHRMDDGEMSFAIGRAADGTLAIECSAACLRKVWIQRGRRSAVVIASHKSSAVVE